MPSDAVVAEEPPPELIPRSYQLELMKIAKQRNSIIYLPTGSGKTYIALLLLKQMLKPLEKPWQDGGKIGIMLVNTVALVEQHHRYLERHTPLRVTGFSGELNVDFWNKMQWETEVTKFNMFVMTSKILENALKQHFLDINRIHLIIFDECHHATEAHTMREIMKEFEYAVAKPKVLGLTATLLNKTVKSHRVTREVENLEVSLHSKVATVDDLDEVSIFSTNPDEYIETYNPYELSETDNNALYLLQNLSAKLDEFHLREVATAERICKRPDIELLEKPVTYKKLARLVADTRQHILELGTYGGLLGVQAHLIQLEQMKYMCKNREHLDMIKVMMSVFMKISMEFKKAMKGISPARQIMEFSSDKLAKLFHIIDNFTCSSNQPLCSLVFVTRRFTAQILYHILDKLSKLFMNYDYLKCNYVVGYNVNPMNNTRAGLFEAKINKMIIADFCNKKLNLLVCSDVMEEGIDIPSCSLVVKFDKPSNYRSYVQSKGRTRHKEGKYIMMVETNDVQRFQKKLSEYNDVDRCLVDYLVGGNETRCAPSNRAIERTYNELELPTYYVAGGDSAHVSMNSAVALVHFYCSSLPSDLFTQYAPTWFLEKTRKTMRNGILGMRAIAELPSICPISDEIAGDFMSNKRKAKQAVALEICMMLHSIGELDDNLIPKKQYTLDPDTDYLFKHWPAENEPKAGNTKSRRKYTRKIPSPVTLPILPSHTLHLHIIEFTPLFPTDTIDLATTTMHRMYSSPLCYGLVTRGLLPPQPHYPVYVSAGAVQVYLRVNVAELVVTPGELRQLREFHHLVFGEVLDVMPSFLVMDDSAEKLNILVAPVDRTKDTIIWDIVINFKEIKDMGLEPSVDEKNALVVDVDDYQDKIVSKWYRNDSTVYVVTQVCLDMSPRSPFKSNQFSSFNDYFKDRYCLSIVNQQQPLLRVKGISGRMNCLKPRGSAKRKRDDTVLEEELVPEMLVKQDFPACLWIQGKVLPTVFHRTLQLLRAEELRQRIAREVGIGRVEMDVGSIKPLEVDNHLIKEKQVEITLTTEMKATSSPPPHNHSTLMEICDVGALQVTTPSLRPMNIELSKKRLNNEYPWSESQEPKDVRRDLDVTTSDIHAFLKFINHKVVGEERKTRVSPTQPALTYDKDYVHKDIKILSKVIGTEGPDVRDIYQVLASKKCNEIVNLERLETLGDSFLKVAASLYILMKYPDYNEGKATTLKGKLISNKNLFYCGRMKQLAEHMLVSDLEPRNWLPPGVAMPPLFRDKLDYNPTSDNSSHRPRCSPSVFHANVTREEQLSGVLSDRTCSEFLKDVTNSVEVMETDADCETENEEKSKTGQDESSQAGISEYLGVQELADKTVADSVEALLGAYCQSSGFEGGLKLLEWLEIIPASDNLQELFKKKPPSPTIKSNQPIELIDEHLPYWQTLETKIGYHFKNRAYLLQALTHSSYSPNRITRSYERLEFIGDAVLDFLITMYIYEYGGELDPGELTDLRSALVNNEIFAAFAVRLHLHKYLLYMSPKLQGCVETYLSYMEKVEYRVNSDMLVMIDDGDVNSAENIDVPKALGDVFESLVGAIFLDCGMDLKTVWRIVYKYMWKEIDLFSACVPKNPVRLLYETPGSHPEFLLAEEKHAGLVMMPLQINLNGETKIVHGFGSNKKLAKKAAAKVALYLLSNKT